MKKITAKERIYRSKIIAENHFKKYMQRYLDFYVAENKDHSINLTYKYIYLHYSLLRHIELKYGLNKIGNALRDVGVSCMKAASSFQNLKTALSKFNCTQ